MRHFLDGSLRCNCAKCNKIARDEEKEKKVDDIANEKEKEKEESRRAEEHEKEELRKKTPEELDEIKAALEEELERLRPKKDTKQARSRYDVLGYNQLYSASTSGDEFLIKQGSRD